MKNMRGWMIAFGLVASANTLRAEPIPWNYSSTVTILGGTPWMDFVPEQVISGATANSVVAAVVWGNSPWEPLSGSRTLTVGEAHPGNDFAPNDFYLTRVGTSFDFVFNLQDAKSGESTALSFRGYVRENFTMDNDPPHVIRNRSESIYVRDPVIGSPWFALNRLRLGDNDYTLGLKERQDGFGTAYIDAVVQVEAIHETPEPSTMAMGAIGLGSLAMGWWRRRKKSGGRVAVI